MTGRAPGSHVLVPYRVDLPPSLRQAIIDAAAARKVTQAAVARWALTLGLRELDRRVVQHVGGSVTVETPADGRLEAVWQALADRRLRARAGRVTNVGSWRRKVMANARRDQGAEAARLCATYPDAPPSVLAAALDGCTEQLRYERRVSS